MCIYVFDMRVRITKNINSNYKKLKIEILFSEDEHIIELTLVFSLKLEVEILMFQIFFTDHNIIFSADSEKFEI